MCYFTSKMNRTVPLKKNHTMLETNSLNDPYHIQKTNSIVQKACKIIYAKPALKQSKKCTVPCNN